MPSEGTGDQALAPRPGQPDGLARAAGLAQSSNPAVGRRRLLAWLGAATRAGYSVAGLMLFILALETLKRGAGGLKPILNGVSADGVLNLLGFGWSGAYAVMSNGTFGFLAATGLRTRAQLKGYARRQPGLALAFSALLFCLGGVPPTGGFVAKLLVLWQAVAAELPGPAVLAALSALISLGYYLGLVRDLYFEEPVMESPAPGGACARILVLVCAFGALALGAAPLLLKDLAGGFWR